MADTRPSGLPIVPDAEALITQELSEIDSRGRLHMLPRWTRRMSWLSAPTAEAVLALMILDEPGRLSIVGWEPFGPKIVDRYRELAAVDVGRDNEALRVLLDRYHRLSVPSDRRPSLGDAALQHLGLPTTRGVSSNVYVVVSDDQVTVLAPAYRNSRNEQGHGVLEGLP